MLRDPLPDHSRVAVLGMGESGCAAARLLLAFGKEVSVFDSRRTARLPDYLSGARAHPGSLDASGFGAVVVSPGLNPTWPEHAARPELGGLLERARRGELKLLSEVCLARSAFKGRIIAVGGTDGKSTVAAMTAHLAKSVCSDSALCGNSWTPMSQVLMQRPELRLLIAEISAFQLWDPHKFYSDVAVLTNIAPDHLDYFASEEDYIDAKLKLLEDVRSAALFYGGDQRLAEVASSRRAAGGLALSYDEADSGADITIDTVDGVDCFRVNASGRAIHVPVEKLSLTGAHNQRNALAALSACALGLDDADRERLSADILGHALESFTGLKHRLEKLRVLNGVTYFNDSKATNIHAAVTGLRSLPQERLVVITGGVDKGLPLDPLVEALEHRARLVVSIGELRRPLATAASGRLNIQEADSLQAALGLAAEHALPGDAVVLSPAASSFDMFSSFEERGDIFSRAVAEL